MKKFYSLLSFLALFFSVLFVGNLEAAIYCIDGTNGRDSNLGTIALPWKTIVKANSTLRAGDTVYLRAGIYTSEFIQINPANSGTSGNYITYQNFDSEEVTISGGRSRHVDLISKSWIKIDGIKFYDCVYGWMRFDNTDNCVIQNCTFEDSAAYSGILLKNGSDYNKFFNNTFETGPVEPNTKSNPPDFIMIRSGSHNIFEENAFAKCSHVALEFQGSRNNYNVIRNNTFRNHWHTGLNIYTNSDWNLAEGNRFYDQGANFLNDDPTPQSKRLTNPGLQLGSSNCIIRRNIADNCGAGLMMNSQDHATALDNRVYHNTWNSNVRNHYTGTDYTVSGHVFKNNNLTFGQTYGDEVGYDIYFGYGKIGYNTWQNNNFYGGANNTYKGNTSLSISVIQATYPSELSGNVSYDPLFTDSAGRVFTLQLSSPLIDAGTWLTIITSSTANNQTFFTVDDASYFYDGWTIPDETGDQIKTENGQTATISSINYDTNTITVTTAIDIVNDEGLSLNYSGAAPDIGAYEYEIIGNSPVSPTELKLLLGN